MAISEDRPIETQISKLPRQLSVEDGETTQAALGRLLRGRREEIGLTGTAVARQVGCTSQFYRDIEKGSRSAKEISAWLRLADILQLDRRWLLERAWESKDGFSLALPSPGDPRRQQLLALAVDLYSPEEAPVPLGELR